MFGAISRAAALRKAAAGMALAVAASAVTLAPIEAAAADRTVTVNVTRFKALDRADELSAGDFFARVTINGKSQSTAVISDRAAVQPEWALSAVVPDGDVDVKLELIDKDVSVDDPIDINRISGKRDLDFTVNTRTCRIDGFAEVYKCGTTISRAGTERKKAEITFRVTVK